MADQKGQIVDVDFLGQNAPIAVVCFENAVRVPRRNIADPKYADLLEVVTATDLRDVVCGLRDDEAYDFQTRALKGELDETVRLIRQKLLDAGVLLVDNAECQRYAVSTDEAGVLEFESLNE